MRKNLKKITRGTAAVLLAAAMFAGCGDSTTAEEETLARSATTTAAEENTTAQADTEDDTAEAEQTEADSTGAAEENAGGSEATETGGDAAAEKEAEQTTEAATQQEELTCTLLYEAAAEQAADGAAQLTVRDTCTFVTKTYRDSLEDFYYAADSEQVYCVCIVKADSEANAAAILQEFNDTLESAQNDMYLTTDEQKVVKTAVTGSRGCYVWYISLSEDSDVVKAAESAVKATIESFQ